MANTQSTLANIQKTTDITSSSEPKSQIELYPNPFSSSINIKVGNPDEILRITISDMMGKQVETIEHSAVSNLTSMGASLKPGTYVVQVYGVNWLKSFKVIKVN